MSAFDKEELIKLRADYQSEFDKQAYALEREHAAALFEMLFLATKHENYVQVGKDDVIKRYADARHAAIQFGAETSKKFYEIRLSLVNRLLLLIPLLELLDGLENSDWYDWEQSDNSKMLRKLVDAYRDLRTKSSELQQSEEDDNESAIRGGPASA